MASSAYIVSLVFCKCCSGGQYESVYNLCPSATRGSPAWIAAAMNVSHATRQGKPSFLTKMLIAIGEQVHISSLLIVDETFMLCVVVLLIFKQEDLSSPLSSQRDLDLWCFLCYQPRQLFKKQSSCCNLTCQGTYVMWLWVMIDTLRLYCYDNTRAVFPWWHDMETLSLLLGESTGCKWIPLMKGQQCRALVFSALSGWINCWANTQVASELTHHNVHVTLMFLWAHNCYATCNIMLYWVISHLSNKKNQAC